MDLIKVPNEENIYQGSHKGKYLFMELKKVNQELYSVEKYGGKIFFKGSRKECFRIMRRESVYNAIRKAINNG